MFERFTDNARSSLSNATAEARRLQHHHVGMHHLLVGLAADDGAAATLLQQNGLSAVELRAQLERIAGPTRYPSGADLPFTAELGRMLAGLFRVPGPICTLRLLLGVLADDQGLAVKLISLAGVEPNPVLGEARRQEASAIGEPNTLADRLAAQLRTVPETAATIATRMGHRYIGGEHLLLALGGLPGSVSASAIRWSGLPVAALEQDVVNRQPRTTSPSEPACWLPLVFEAWQGALRIACTAGDREVDSGHLLMALATQEGTARQVLHDHKVDENALAQMLHGLRSVATAPVEPKRRDYQRLAWLAVLREKAMQSGVWLVTALAIVLGLGYTGDLRAVAVAAVSLLVYRGSKVLWWIGVVVSAVLGVPLLWLVLGPGVLFAARLGEALFLRPWRIDAPQPPLRLRDNVSWRAARLIRRGDRHTRRVQPEQALDCYEQALAHTRSPELRALVIARCAMSLEATGSLQRALDAAGRAHDLISNDPSQSETARVALVISAAAAAQLNDIVLAREAISGAMALGERAPARDKVAMAITYAEIERRAGNVRGAVEVLNDELSRIRVTARDQRFVVRLLLALSSARDEAGDLDGAGAAVASALTMSMLMQVKSGHESMLVLPTRLAHVAEAELDAVPEKLREAQVALREGKAGGLERKIGFVSQDAAGRSALALGNGLFAAQAAMVLSEFHLAEDRPANAIWYASRAMAALDEHRYQLRSQAHRVAWFASMTRASALVLELTSRFEPQHLAEVIENMRLQALPGSSAEILALDRAGAREVELAHPPAVVLAETARTDLARLLGVGRRSVGVRDCAAAAFGYPAHWYGLWSNEATLYWGLVRPDGTCAGGTIPFGDGSPLRAALTSLHRALPIHLSGESVPQYQERIDSSPLWTSHQDEKVVTRLLAELLLPNELRAALASGAAGAPVRLLIAPPPELARIPWGLLPFSVDATDDRRIVEVAEWLLAPPVALLHHTLARPRVRAKGLGIVVLDPTGDLRNVHGLLNETGPEPIVLTGPWNGHTANADRAGLSGALRATPRDRVAFIACHCVAARPGQSLESALSLSPPACGGAAEQLSAHDLIVDDRARPSFPLPVEVVLSACDSAGAAAAEGGEWLSIGPAALWAGADTAIVSVFQVSDDSVDRFLLKHARATDRTGSLAHDLWTYQRQALRGWRNDPDEHEAPLYWASYAVMGNLGRTSVPAVAADVAPRRAMLSKAAADLVESVGRHSEFSASDGVVTTVDLAFDWLSENSEDLMDGPLVAMMLELLAGAPAAAVVREPLLGRMRKEEARQAKQVGNVLSDDLILLLEAASRRAAQHARDAVAPQDIALALLDHNCAGHRLFKMSRYGQRAASQRALAGAADWQYLTPATPERITDSTSPRIAQLVRAGLHR